MKQSTILSFLCIVTVIFTANCGGETQSESKFPYQLVNSQAEMAEEHAMDLYAYSGPLNKETLIEFCKMKKAEWELAGFYVAVIFDSKENVVKSTSPISAPFGNQVEAMKHIRAVYQTTGFNDFSELTIYDPNMYTGTPEVIKVSGK